MSEWIAIGVPVAAGLFSWFGSHIAVKTHLDYLRRDVDLAHKRLDDMHKIQYFKP